MMSHFTGPLGHNMALNRDARNSGFGLRERLRGRPLALL